MFSATPTRPGITASSNSMMPNLLRPRRPSTCRPKYQKMAIVMTVHRSGTFASGHVTRRHSSPLLTSSGSNHRYMWAVSLAAQRNRLATHAMTTSIVVVMSSVPIRNHGSLVSRRSGTENENRPAMAHNRILDS